MDNKSYYVSKNRKKKDALFFEYDKVDGYKVSPKVRKDDQIEVSKIVFVNPELSEKIIRKKIDRKIEYLLKKLKEFDNDEGGTTESDITKTLMDAEKLRLQIINNYVKYLGHTYESLTLKKIQIIADELRYKLYIQKEQERYRYFYDFEQPYQQENRRGR